VLFIVLMATSGVVRADAEAETVPDASLRAVIDRVVQLDVQGRVIEGRVLGFEDSTVTIANVVTGEVTSVPRAQLVRVTLVEPSERERRRVWGLQSSLLGTVVVDVERGRLRGFASTNLLLPLITLSGESTWFAGAVGAGVSWPMSATSHWKLDLFGEVLPFHTTSFYTYLGVGVGGGFHYTAPSGFTLGFTFPIVGFASRLGHSPYGYEASFRYNDSLAYYYVGALAGMPLLTFGYRFAAH